MWLLLLLLLAVLFIVTATAKFRIHPFLALLAAAFGYGIFCGRLSLAEVLQSINEGFGGTIGNVKGGIGIVIVAGAIIGVILEKSGGALKVAESALKLTGKKNVPMAMGIVGYIVSIPVFCDSGFIILSPLNKALSRKAKISLAGGAVALSLGLYATHTMVPPTPGPVAAAALLGADLGMVIGWGLLVSVISLAAGWLFAVKVAAKVQIEPYEEGESEYVEVPSGDAPSAAKSVVPIFLPIVLILLKSISDLKSYPFGDGDFANALRFIGNPVVALLLGVLLACFLPKKFNRDMLSTKGWVGEAVTAAAVIIVITASGGAFGKVLQRSDIAKVVEQLLGGSNLGIWFPFAIAAALKTAQGSSTVAMITTATIMSPMMEALGLDSPSAKALSVVAIGAGAMVVSHANDSYFWVVTQFSKMSVNQGYKLQTLGTLVEGGVAAVVVWILATFIL